MDDPRMRLRQLLAPVVEQAGQELEDLSVSPAGRRRVVRVVVDADGGVSLDDVATASRALSEALDDIDSREPALLGGAYVLEVSSPGVDRPLTAPRHWRRNRTRLVAATLRDGGAVTGRVVEADDDEAGGVVLDVEGTPRRLPYTDLVRGQVQVEFARAATATDEGEADVTDDVDEDDEGAEDL